MASRPSHFSGTAGARPCRWPASCWSVLPSMCWRSWGGTCPDTTSGRECGCHVVVRGRGLELVRFCRAERAARTGFRSRGIRSSPDRWGWAPTTGPCPPPLHWSREGGKADNNLDAHPELEETAVHGHLLLFHANRTAGAGGIREGRSTQVAVRPPEARQARPPACSR